MLNSESCRWCLNSIGGQNVYENDSRKTPINSRKLLTCRHFHRNIHPSVIISCNGWLVINAGGLFCPGIHYDRDYFFLSICQGFINNININHQPTISENHHSLKIMGSQVTGGLEIQKEPCVIQGHSPLFFGGSNR